MREVRWRRAGAFLALTLAAALAIAVFSPDTSAETDMQFDPAVIGDDVDAYLARAEAQFDDIRPGVEKRVIWAEAPNTQTAVSVLYVHGFSASSEEIRPVPDNVAAGLGANLVFTRLTGHGRTGPAMAEATLEAWMGDMAEALAVARAVGEEVIVMSTSTGGTLATLAALDPELSQNVRGQVLVSPNFAIASPIAQVMTWPLVRYWGPLLAGKERRFEPRSPKHGLFWTTQYPTVAVLPMAEAVKAVRKADLSTVTQPALMVYSKEDQIVSPAATEAVAARWGGPVTRHVMTMGPGDDPLSHVVAGDILSPGQTDGAVERILAWVAELPTS